MSRLLCRLVGHRVRHIFGHPLPLAPITVVTFCDRCYLTLDQR